MMSLRIFAVLSCTLATVEAFVGPHSIKESSCRSPSQLYEIQSSLVSVRDIPKEESPPEPKKMLYHVDFQNFWQKTRGNFTPCERPHRPPDYKSKKSWYWDVDDEYVIRSSNHWSNVCGNIKDCFWTFDEEAFRDNSKTKKVWLTGKCDYADLEHGKKSSMRGRANDRKVIKAAK